MRHTCLPKASGENEVIPTRGDIFYADLPYEENLQSGPRYVIVTQNDKGNKYGPRVHVVPLSGRIHKKAYMPTRVVIQPTEQNGLKIPSVAITENLRPVPKSALLRHAGKLEEDKYDEVAAAARLHLAL